MIKSYLCVVPLLAVCYNFSVAQPRVSKVSTTGSIFKLHITESEELLAFTSSETIKFLAAPDIAESFPINRPIPGKGVNDLIALDNGVIWISRGDSLGIWKNNKFSPIYKLPSKGMRLYKKDSTSFIVYGQIKTLSEDNKAESHIYYLENAGLRLNHLLAFSGSIVDVCILDNKIYFSTNNAVYRMANEEVEPFFVPETFGTLYSIYTHPSQKYLLIGGENGVVSVDVNNGNSSLIYSGTAHDVVSLHQTLFVLEKISPNTAFLYQMIL